MRALALAGLALLVAACGEPSSEVLVQVNRERIHAQQLDALLQRQGAAGADAATQRQLLERLIDQELAVQAVEAQQLDRDPAVRLQLEAARREVLARVFADRAGAELPAPTPEQVARFYAEQPQLFAQRKVYRLQEVGIEAEPAQIPGLRAALAQAADLPAFVERLRAEGRRVSVNTVLRAPEQLPAAALAALERMQDGHVAAHDAANGLQLVQRLGAQPAPLSEEQARPVIEKLLLARARQERLQAELARLRKEARIEYQGRFAAPAASAASL